jgi:hypothetical protein
MHAHARVTHSRVLHAVAILINLPIRTRFLHAHCAYTPTRHNGRYVQTRGLMEQDLMDRILGYLKQHEAPGSKPFLMYYAPHAIHQCVPVHARPASPWHTLLWRHVGCPLPAGTLQAACQARGRHYECVCLSNPYSFCTIPGVSCGLVRARAGNALRRNRTSPSTATWSHDCHQTLLRSGLCSSTWTTFWDACLTS